MCSSHDEVELELREDLMRGSPAQDIARRVIQGDPQPGQTGLRERQQIQALGHELAEDVIGVLMGSAQPGPLSIAEVIAHVKPPGQSLVPNQLRALVSGQRVAQAGRDAAKPAEEAFQNPGGTQAARTHEHDAAAGAFHALAHGIRGSACRISNLWPG